MSPDPNTPVIVGVGQFLHGPGASEPSPEPTDMMLEALSSAEADAGSALAASAGVVAVVPVISWRYQDPGRIVADRIGADGARTWYPAMGGNTPQMMLNRLASRIAAGSLETGVLCGAEAWNTRTSARRAGAKPDWTVQDPSVVPDWGSEDTFSMGHPAEHAKTIVTPVQTYPLFETALMHEALRTHPGRTLAEQIRLVGEMWAGFSKVAASNPYAWSRNELDAQQITTATEKNRFVGWPYTKAMVSNPDVDMASALIVTSAGRAERAGVPRDRWVFCLSGTDGKDRVMSQRSSFLRSPSIGVAGHRALELARVDLDDVAHLDLYSCFPSAVELFCREFDLDPLARQLTVYGGLAFAGGPWNNPVGHALATMVDVLREDPGSVGLVTANGGNVDKHAFGVFSTTPPRDGFAHECPQSEIDAAADARTILESYEGGVEVEAWTVMHDRDNSPQRFHAACLTPQGDRVWAVSEDEDLMATATTADIGGRAAKMGSEGELELT